MISASRACLALSLIAEPGDPRLLRIVDDRDPVAALSLILAGPDSRHPSAWGERARRLDELVATALVRAKSSGLRWLARSDRAWPEQLDDLNHVEPINGVTGAPLGLWLRGKGDLADLTERSVAVVGARAATTYGAEISGDLGSDLSDCGFTVVSGAAYGIDACAHRGALAMDKSTIAVLAGGADIDYPKSNAALLARIAATGLVVSEQMPGATPLKGRFLSRNRIIAALTQGTVVVEAARRSGSLNTLNWADQLGRMTMGVPGPVTSQASDGVHEAMRTGQAMLVTSGADVIEALGELGAVDSTPPRAAETAYDALSPDTRRVLDALPWSPPRRVVEISDELRLTAAATERELKRLELLGYAGQMTHGWALLRRADLV